METQTRTEEQTGNQAHMGRLNDWTEAEAFAQLLREEEHTDVRKENVTDGRRSFGTGRPLNWAVTGDAREAGDHDCELNYQMQCDICGRAVDVIAHLVLDA